MKRGKRQQKLAPLRLENSPADKAANIAERQKILKQTLFNQASIIGDDAPVAMVCVLVFQDGRTSTILTNIESEHLPLLSAASARLRKRMSDFFSEVQKNSAVIHHIKHPKK